jgi:hypothetical protein
MRAAVRRAILLAACCLAFLASPYSRADECPANWKTLRPEWIWCDDFETDKVAGYFDRTGPFLRTAGAGLNGSYGMRATWGSGTVDAGSLKLAIGLTPPGSGIAPPAGVDSATRFREVYYRVYLRSEAGWNSGTSSNHSKFSRATSFVAPDWSQAMIAHFWSGGRGNSNNYLRNDPAGCVSGTVVRCVGYNDFPRLKWLGAVNGTTAVFAPPNAGTWNCIEMHVRLNNPGMSNGVAEFWVDGHLETSRSNLNFVDGYAEYGINAVLLENYINNGSPQPQSRFWDNFVVSTRRIGCLPN